MTTELTDWCREGSLPWVQEGSLFRPLVALDEIGGTLWRRWFYRGGWSFQIQIIGGPLWTASLSTQDPAAAVVQALLALKLGATVDVLFTGNISEFWGIRWLELYFFQD